MARGPHPEESFEELVARTGGLQPWRRVVHMAFGAGIAWVVYTLTPQSPATRWLFGGALAVTFLGELLRLRFGPLNRLFFRAFAALVSPREAEAMVLPWYLLGVFSVLWISGGTFAVPSILVLAFADPAAGTVGRLWGKRRLGKGTLEGSAAFFVMAVAVLFPFVGVTASVAVAAFVAAIEILPTGLNDNFLVPVAAAVGLWVMMSGVA